MQTNKKALNRHEKIRDLLIENGCISLQELCTLLNCSQATIRNDLACLDRQGVIKRIHGGAVLNENTSRNTGMDKRIKENMQEKKKIAQYVVEHVMKENVVITLDSGTTTMEVALEIANKNFPCTVITNSFSVASILKDCENIKLILAGGLYDSKHQSFHDEISDWIFKNYHSDVCFISPNGISEKGVVTNAGTSENAIKKRMMKNASRRVLLADHSKFGNIELNILGDVHDFDGIVCDAGIKAEYYNALKLLGYDIQIA